MDAAEDVVLRRVRVSQEHWRAAEYFLDDSYLRSSAIMWLNGWAMGGGVELEWTSSLIVHVRSLADMYFKVLVSFLRKGQAPPDSIVIPEVLDEERILQYVDKFPAVLWSDRCVGWLEPIAWHSPRPWNMFILGPPSLMRRALRTSRDGAILACVKYAPKQLRYVLQQVTAAELHTRDRRGRTLLQLSARQPLVFCALARAGACEDGAIAAVMAARARGRITSSEGRRMRRALRPRQARCLCW